MNIKTVKQEQKRFTTPDFKSLGIQSYDTDNLYPQRLIKLVDASGTAGLCVDTYKKFIEGKGLLDSILYREKVGRNGETVDQVHALICSDLAKFGGCAIHVNYNLLGEQVSIAHVPFENARLTIPDANNYVSQIVVFHDWAKEKTTTRISKDTIDYIHRYNPEKSIVQAQITAAGGIEYYKGQILYINLDGAECVYPKPVYDSIITDMSTEIGCANIRYRSARNNFLPAGMLIRKGVPMNDTIESDDQYSHEEDEFTTQFKKFQGDENAAKILDVEIESGEEAPEFVPFEGKNHSIEYRETEKQAQENIGKRFNQPPILRCEAVSQGFSTDVMQDAYDYYNSVTDVERRLLERVYTRIFAGRSQTNDYSIIPLQYGEKKASQETVTKVVEIITGQLQPKQKEIVLSLLGIDSETSKKLIYGNSN